MKVLVCGGRNYSDSMRVCDVLGKLHADGPISLLIHGDAPGADALADAWARSVKVEVVAVRALWDLHGRAAGPIRNQRMLDEYEPDLVVAFPGGRGTRDMVIRARAGGWKVQDER